MNLQSRILLLFVALLLGIQSISFWLIRAAIEDNARASISSQLEVGERFFMRALLARGSRLTEATTVLSTDLGFRSALGSGDLKTAESALANQLDRAKASTAIYFSPSFEPMSQSGHRLSREAMDSLRAKARKSNDAGSFLIVVDAGQIHQFALAAIRLPKVVGWVAIGFPVDQRALDEMKAISGFDAMIVLEGTGGRDTLALSTFEGKSQRAELSAALLATPEQRASRQDGAGVPPRQNNFGFPSEAIVGGSVHGARAVSLSNDPGSSSYAVLTQSLDTARAPYAKLQWTLLALGLGGCATFAFGALLLARSITRPIVELSLAAESLAEGDFEAALPARSPGEVGDLARSFERMRQSLSERERRIQRLAYWDTLTGLPNREQFKEKLAATLDEMATLSGSPCCSVAHIDVDRLKNVNDTLGQDAGDALLREVANRLGSLDLPVGGMAARLSGDKFALLLPGVCAHDAEKFAAKIHALFEEPAQIGPSRIDISAGIGLCGVPEHADTLETAMSRAEFAMYAAKQAKAPTLVYDPKLDSSSEASLGLLSELRTAIANGELTLHYQAKADLVTGQIVGAEALARWMHPERGYIPPDAFIPFAEQTGFIGQISRWAVDQSCKAIARMQKAGLDLKISANISTRDLLDVDFLTGLESSLKTSGASPSLLCLEITEGSLMDNPERSLQAMALIRGMGVELSIDDFGTGYSSLGYLRRMPLNELKIDRVFILGLARGSPADEKIVSSTIDLAHALNLRVVAEGAEDPLCFAKLRDAGCDLVQGYGVSKPIPEAAFMALFEDWDPGRMPG